jgi:hypothetical protein
MQRLIAVYCSKNLGRREMTTINLEFPIHSLIPVPIRNPKDAKGLPVASVLVDADDRNTQHALVALLLTIAHFKRDYLLEKVIIPLLSLCPTVSSTTATASSVPNNHSSSNNPTSNSLSASSKLAPGLSVYLLIAVRALSCILAIQPTAAPIAPTSASASAVGGQLSSAAAAQTSAALFDASAAPWVSNVLDSIRLQLSGGRQSVAPHDKEVSKQISNILLYCHYCVGGLLQTHDITTQGNTYTVFLLCMFAC